MSACPPCAADSLAGLNEAQRRAVEFGIAAGAVPGPLLVIAGAGSGKTDTLVHRAAHLIAHGTDPGALLLLTFSRRAAEEMTRRVRRLVAAGSGAQVAIPWSGTFHAIGARLLRHYAARIGLDPAFTIHDRADSADLMNLVRHEAGFSAKDRRFPLKDTCLAIYSAAVNTRSPLGEVLQASFPWCAAWEDALKTLFRAYVGAKQAQHVLDYDDLLLCWAQMMGEPCLAAELGRRFAHVLVDEYQDTNRLQAAILLALKPDGAGLTVVGDDAQAIYAFRGATVRNILDFPHLFEPPACRVTLERNYRSTQPILDAANAVIALAGERYDKRLWTERTAGARPRIVTVPDEAAQADYTVARTLARREAGMPLRDQAILFRACHHSARLEIELVRRDIPYVKFGGLRFLDAAHVKDIMAVLRWAQNRRDRLSGFRAIQLLPGCGPKTAGRILDGVAGAAPGCELLAEQDVPAASRAAWQAFAALLDELATARAWPASFERLCRWYEGEMPRRYADAAARLADVAQLARIAATYPDAARFATELTLDPPAAASGEAGTPLLDEDYLVLSTIHSAKGREWPAVSVLHVVDGCIPSDLATGTPAAVEEERRLLYVAMTRAKAELELLVPLRFYTGAQPAAGDRHVHAGRSRFLPARLLPLFESAAWPPACAAPQPQAGVGAGFDLQARVRAMWD
jgi:DNA helicase-2/ATP-dependent DNA helicase PcrA